MSQHDYNIANAGGAAVRSDINNALAAVQSMNSGSTEPTATKPFMPWYDTATGALKMRNAADTAWISSLEAVGGSQGVNFRNRIINGGMRINQRGSGVLTVNSTASFYPVDRFVGQGESALGVFTIQQSTDAPAGFTNSILATVTTADATLSGSTVNYVIAQVIEGNNVADLAFGTSAASTITLSFWAKSSITGSLGGVVSNSAGTSARAYGFLYTINAANTWEYKTITIAGDTTGTWAKDNTAGMTVFWSLGANAGRKTTANAWSTLAANASGATGETAIIATNGATLYLAGVQIEAGAIASPFEQTPYGLSVALCQRYYQSATGLNVRGYIAGTTVNTRYWALPFNCTMRTTPSVINVVTSGVFTLSSTTEYLLSGFDTSQANTTALINISSFNVSAEL